MTVIVLHRFGAGSTKLTTNQRFAEFGRRNNLIRIVPTDSRIDPWYHFVRLTRVLHHACTFKCFQISVLPSASHDIPIMVVLKVTNKCTTLRHLNLGSELSNSSRWSELFSSVPDLEVLQLRNVNELALRKARRHFRNLRELLVQGLTLLRFNLAELINFPKLRRLCLLDLNIGYTSPMPALVELENLRSMIVHARNRRDDPLVQNLALTIIAPKLARNNLLLSEGLQSVIYIDRGVAYDENDPLRPED